MSVMNFTKIFPPLICLHKINCRLLSKEHFTNDESFKEFRKFDKSAVIDSARNFQKIQKSNGTLSDEFTDFIIDVDFYCVEIKFSKTFVEKLNDHDGEIELLSKVFSTIAEHKNRNSRRLIKFNNSKPTIFIIIDQNSSVLNAQLISVGNLSLLNFKTSLQ
jgi:hypothetical protein